MTHITIYTSMTEKRKDNNDDIDTPERIYPKCHPYWMIDGQRVENQDVKQVAYTAQGYLLPCCWCDHGTWNRKRHIAVFGLFDEALKVENVKDIETEILQSPEWYNFHETLLQNPRLAPFVCKQKCSKPSYTSSRKQRKQIMGS